MTLEKSLELRRKIKAKKPDFIRQDAYRFAKLKNLKHWRRPVGRHSKIRAKKKGQATLVRWGFGSPKEVRGLMRSGHEPVHVFNASDVTKLDPKKQVAIVGGSVGARKRLAIVAAAEKKGVGIWNIEVTSYHADIALYILFYYNSIIGFYYTIYRFIKKRRSEWLQEVNTIYTFFNFFYICFPSYNYFVLHRKICL
jgi:large subunit ribosomal protein L32e